MSNPIVEKIEEALNPAVGSAFAKASVEVACKTAGVKIEEVSHQDLPVIAEKLKDGLTMLFGSAIAEGTAAKVKSL